MKNIYFRFILLISLFIVISIFNIKTKDNHISNSYLDNPKNNSLLTLIFGQVESENLQMSLYYNPNKLYNINGYYYTYNDINPKDDIFQSVMNGYKPYYKNIKTKFYGIGIKKTFLNIPKQNCDNEYCYYESGNYLTYGIIETTVGGGRLSSHVTHSTISFMKNISIIKNNFLIYKGSLNINNETYLFGCSSYDSCLINYREYNGNRYILLDFNNVNKEIESFNSYLYHKK